MKEEDPDPQDKDYKPHKIPSRMAAKIPESEKNGRRSRRHPDTSESKADTQVGLGSDDEVSSHLYWAWIQLSEASLLYGVLLL